MIWMIENFEGTLEEICLPALLEQAAPENKTKKKTVFSVYSQMSLSNKSALSHPTYL